MITNSTYIGYAGEIAALFCEGAVIPNLCNANVKQRLINSFTDVTFAEHFLPMLDSNRFYLFEVVNVEDYGEDFKVTINGFDVVTGRIINIGIQGVNKGAYNTGDWDRILRRVDYRLVGYNGEKIIARKPGLNYGIVFVPAGIPPPPPDPVNGNGGTPGNGGAPGNGGINFVPKPTIKPPVTIPQELFTGIDIVKYVVPAGLIVVAYLVTRK